VSFEEIWQGHRRFILSLVGGFVVFMAAWSIIEGAYEKDIEADRRGIAASRRKARGQKPPPGRVAAIDGEIERLEAELGTLETELSFKSQQGFTLAGSTRSPDIHFNQTVEKMLEVVELALSLDIRVQTDLGIGGITPRTDVEREWYLNGLDVVNRVALAGIAAGVRSIEPIQIASSPSSKKRGRKAGVESPYCREVSISFTSTGHPAAIDGMIRGLMIPGARLAVERAEIVSLDTAGGKKTKGWTERAVRLEMTVKALILDAEGEPSIPKTQRL